MDEADLARLRRDYAETGLTEDMLPADPLALFHTWLDDAAAAALAEVNAMVVSTVGADGAPSSRLVLCKVADERGFVFFTNYESRKGRELGAESRAALLFPWHVLGRQVRIEGTVSRTERSESEAYFATRPRGAQLAAWSSSQSSVLDDRAVLEDRVTAAEATYAGSDVPCPPHWGGLRVRPRVIEFWQGRRDRLHDRLVYRRRDGADAWSVHRLAP